jgi:hypothetical protein
MHFIVKVRIDVSKLADLGRLLQSRALDLGAMQWTYCHADDPAVGLSLWQAEDRDHLERVLAPLRPYYAEVMEVTPVVTSREAQARLARSQTGAS